MSKSDLPNSPANNRQAADADKAPLFESLSALMDGEASDLEVRRLLKIENDPERKEVEQRWQRYQLASAALGGDIKGSLDKDMLSSLATNIRIAVDAEPALSLVDQAPKQKVARPKFWSNIARLGVAASVAGAVVVAVQFAPNPSDHSIATIPASQPKAATPLLAPDATIRAVGQESPGVTTDQKQPIILNETTQHQLEAMKLEAKRLMLEHAQNASQHTPQGVLPYVRVPESDQ